MQTSNYAKALPVGYVCLQEFFMDHALQKLKGPQIHQSCILDLGILHLDK